MPLVSCPACRRSLQVRPLGPNEVVACPHCGHRFNPPVVRRDDGPDDDESGTDLGPKKPAEEPASKVAVQTVALIGGLVVALVIIFFLVTRLIGGGKQQEAKADPKADAAVVAKERDRLRQAEADRKRQEMDDERLAEEGQKEVARVGSVLLAVMTLAAVIVYVVAIFWVGAVIARDAARRGMNGLGWCSFYFFFQFFFRTAVFLSFGRLPLILLPLGAVSLLFLEPFAWVGWAIYTYAKRPGSVLTCENCAVPMLNYLPRCPHCDVKNADHRA